MHILGIGLAILGFLGAIFLFVNFGHLIKFPKRKSAITNPPWALDGTVTLSFACPECGHEDIVTEAIVKCVRCKEVVKPGRNQPSEELPRPTYGERIKPFGS